MSINLPEKDSNHYCKLSVFCVLVSQLYPEKACRRFPELRVQNDGRQPQGQTHWNPP